MQIPSLWVGLAALLPVSAGVHYANEYADYLTDRLTTRTLFSGGSGALAEMGLPQRSALWAAWGALALAAPASLWAGMVFPRRPWPFPAVLAMVLILAGQTVAWWMAFP